ncbi:MAG: cellulase family glycosylhydrolase [Actinobacteria bacterium]|nr:cellulase family glycosylhydrolase [Actinomycetota bacterium]
MKRSVRFLLAASTAMLLVPAVAGAAPRMHLGFHDDPNFRYEERRSLMLDQARAANTTIVRTLVTWADVAPTRPANASNPFDRAYRFNDLDELVRNTQARDIEVLITIWGTPKWANGNKSPNFLPTRMTDLTAFSRAVASRYSGRFAGFPFVRFYSIWNESNLQLFLAPQFDAAGNSVGPRNYARLAAAAYSGIKAGNPRAKVAIGSTSSAGRDKVLPGKSETHSPARFARLVAAANPRLKFDAWAQHPYPVPVNLKPTQLVRYPNVTLKSFPRFTRDLDTWFKRKNVRIWITEYGHEVREDGEPRGVSRATQAAYAAQALALARSDPRTDMFIWFVFRDHATSEWQSGLRTRTGAPKPSLARFTSFARTVDARNAMFSLRGGVANPTVPVALRQYAAGSKPGERVGFNVKVYEKGKLVADAQPASPLGSDATAKVRLLGFRPVKGHTYSVRVTANIFSGGGVQLVRTLTVIGV